MLLQQVTGEPGDGGGVDGAGLGVTLEQLPGVTDTSSIAISPLYDDPRTPSNVKRV